VSAPIPLSREDRDILALESATIAGHTCKVAVFEGDPPPLAELRESVASRLPDMLRWRLGGTQADPAWVEDDGFEIENHVVAGPANAELEACVAGLFAERLDRSHPLWQIDLVGLRDGGSAIVWRIHHALADGQTCVRLAHAMLWDGSPDPPQAGRAPDQERRQAHLAGFVRREFVSRGARSPFDGKIGTAREVAFAQVPLRDLHDAAKRLAGATLNDAVLSVVAGAVRRWAEEHHGKLGPLRVRVPVSLHDQGEDAGNRDSYFCVVLPLGEPDPVARLVEAHRESEQCKEEHDAEEMDRLLRGLSGVSPSLERMCEQFEGSPRQFALSVSNVRGPAKPVSVLGSPVERLHFVAEIGERHALRVSVNSFAGETLNFGFCSDPQIVDGVEAMAAGVEAEARLLIAA
jgi:Wax ester synthase/diacylglycerol acyltransferase catalytic domain/WS/DGAT C-terminal domain